MAELVEKEWMFNFIGGGWNTVYAKTRRSAYKKAVSEYWPELTPVESSFEQVRKNPKRYEMLMSLFN